MFIFNKKQIFCYINKSKSFINKNNSIKIKIRITKKGSISLNCPSIIHVKKFVKGSDFPKIPYNLLIFQENFVKFCFRTKITSLYI